MQHRPPENIINLHFTGANDRGKSMEKDQKLSGRRQLRGEHRETVQHILSGCTKLTGSEYVKRHDNVLKVLAIENGLLPAETKWYAETWENGKIIESGGKKLYWNWEHRMRTENTHRRPDDK